MRIFLLNVSFHYCKFGEQRILNSFLRFCTLCFEHCYRKINSLNWKLKQDLQHLFISLKTVIREEDRCLLNLKSWYKCFKTIAESSHRSRVFHYYKISNITIWMIKSLKISDLCLMALDLLLHVVVLHHSMQFRNFYLVFLSVSQCQGIAPCYATLELIRL